MEDLEKLEQVFKILDKAVRDISNTGELNDYDLDDAFEDVFDTIDNARLDVYRLIKEMEDKQWKI